MANRHLARSIVLQTLFEWDFRNASGDNTTVLLPVILERNAREYAPGLTDISFVGDLLAGVVEKRGVLDDIIEKAAPDWPIAKIAPVDRNILRLGLYELLFADRGEVPPKVAINEAIELAKSFGGDSSGRFVNGVLGSVYREMGEPGKDQISKKKIKDIPYEEMPIERLGGAIVYAHNEAEVCLALVHDVFGYWTLSKGHLPEGMEEEQALEAKVKEEIGLDIKVGDKVGESEYVAADPEKGKLRKQVIYYLAESPYEEPHLAADKGGLDDVRWFPLSEILDLNFYDDMLPIITKAVNMLLHQEQTEEIKNTN
jgi:N utilization substance protein B